MSEVTFRDAVRMALADEMLADPRVFFLGEDVAAAGGAFKVTDGLLAQFDERRVLDTPISEEAIVGTAIGSAVRGLRPVAELMFADFAGVCFDQIANQLAKYRYMTGGQVSLPVTIRTANGAGLGFGAQHSQTVENWFLNVQGMLIVAPSTPADAYGLLRSAIRCPNPVLVLEHKALYGTKGDLPEDRPLVPLGVAAVRRPGIDVTVVATQLMARRALEAAERLGRNGVSAEVIDLRTIAPMDVDTVLESVAGTGRIAIVQEGPIAGGWGATLLSQLVLAGADLRCRPVMIASPDSPTPYATSLEAAWLPSVERIAATIAETFPAGARSLG
jgi:acetoin:2,6-dichlorophenolindophenol oxidoreductase subunit beta